MIEDERAAHDHGGLHRVLRVTLRGALIAALAILNVALLYLAVANLMIRTGYLRSIMNIDPETAQIDYESAWTAWPGEVHITGYRLRVQDRDLQFSLSLDEAIADIKLTELFGRTFHATRVRGSGVVFRLRQRLTEEEAERPEARSLPPIAGFSDPPMRAIGPPKAPLTDENYNLWTAHLEDVDVAVREVWLDNHCFNVDARVRGGLYFKPLRALEATILADIADGQLHVVERKVAQGIEGTIRVSLARVDLRERKDRAILRGLTGAVRFDAQIVGLAFLSAYLGDYAGVRFEDGSGELRLDAHIADGVIAEGSVASYATRRLDIVTPSFFATIHADVRAALEPAVARVLRGKTDSKGPVEASAPIGRLEINVTEALVRPRGFKKTLLEVEKATMTFETPSRDLAGPVDDVATTIDIPARISDLTIFNGRDAADPSFDAGIAFLRASLRIDPRGRTTGSLRALTGRLRGHWGDLQLGGDVSARVDIDSDDLLSGTLRAPRGHIELKNVVYARDGERKQGWWGRIDLTRMQARERSAVDFEALIQGKFKNAEPFMQLPATHDALPGVVRGLLEMDGLSCNGEIVRRDGELVMSLNKAEGDGATVWGRLRTGKSAARGAVLVKIGPITVGVELGEGGPDFTLLPGKEWVAKHLPPARGAEAMRAR